MSIRTLAALVFLATAALPSSSPAETDVAPSAWRFEPLAEGVWAALQPAEGRFDDSNSLVVELGDGALVVDAQASEEGVRALIAEIERRGAGPVRFLVNTHWHPDHTQGNALYRDRFGAALTIIGHETLTADVPARAATYVEGEVARLREVLPRAEEQLADGLSLSGEEMTAEQRERQRGAIVEARELLARLERARFEAPNLTYGGSLTLHPGGREVRLIPFRAHTRGDTVLYLPAEKILVTGDLLDDLPYGGHGYPRQWIAALDELATLDFEVIVPGHGEIRRGKDHLRLVRELFATLVAGVDAALATGRSLDEAREASDLSELRRRLAGDDPVAQRAFDGFVPETIDRAWAEATGTIEE